MSRRNKIIVAGIILILLILALLFLLLRRQSTTTAQQNANLGTNVPIGELPNAPGGTNSAVNAPATNAPAPQADTRTALKRLAAAFAERFGSYSNASNFDNILDLKVFMTDAMAKWADQYVAAQSAQKQSGQYSGITTRAISETIVAFDETAGTATVVVKTQRQQFSGSSLSGTVIYQDLTLTFVKDGDIWKVDSATWAKQ